MARVLGHRRARKDNGQCESGFSLIELVVAMTIFAIVMLGIAHSIGTGLSLTRNNRHRSVAANLAAQEMDTIRSMSFDAVNPGSSTVDVAGVDYTVYREVTWVAKSATNGPCDGSNGSPQVKRVRVRVQWTNMQGVQPVVSDTTLTPPVGAYDATSGHIGVKILDRSAEPIFNVPVTITGPESHSAPTNSDGCAFFAFLAPGTYTVTLGAFAHVDRQSNPSPSQTKPVVVGATTAFQFDYDRAATLALTLQTDYAYPIPADLPITVATPQLVPNGMKTYAGTGTTQTISDLFPFLEGYHAWAGSCADADPEGQIVTTDAGGNPVVTGEYWPGASRQGLLAVEGGSTTTTAVHLHDAEITVLDPLLLPVVGATVNIVHAPDNLCDTGETHVVGTTDAAGRVNTALPFGTWQVNVTGRTSTAWPNVVIDPRAHLPVPVTVPVL